MNNRLISHQPIAALIVRWALGITFLSAVADRLGWWGAPGAPGVAWGSFPVFLEYTALLNPLISAAFIPALGVFATMAEVVLAVALMLGWWTRQAALASSVLLLLFALGMSMGIGVKAPLDYSVFTAAGAALVLATLPQSGWGVDQWLQCRRAK